MFLLISWRWVRNVVAVIATTSTRREDPHVGAVAVEVKLSEILAPKSVASAKLVDLLLGQGPPSSGCLAAWSISRNSARKIGICSRIGRQEANGLVPVSL